MMYVDPRIEFNCGLLIDWIHFSKWDPHRDLSDLTFYHDNMARYPQFEALSQLSDALKRTTAVTIS
jgi:hypothetical protein